MSGTKNWEANSGKKTRKPCGVLLDDSCVAYADKESTARTFHTPLPDRERGQWKATWKRTPWPKAPPLHWLTNAWPGRWHHSTTLCSAMRGIRFEPKCSLPCSASSLPAPTPLPFLSRLAFGTSLPHNFFNPKKVHVQKTSQIPSKNEVPDRSCWPEIASFLTYKISKAK